MSWTDWLTPIAIGASAYFGSQSADKAADAGAAAAQTSADTQKYMFDTARRDMLPYTETGQQGLVALADIYGVPRPDGQGGFTTGKAFTGTPGYQFRMDEGQKAVDNSFASKGARFSGQRAKALTDYGQNVASEEWGNYTNALRNLAGLGQVSSGQTAAASGQAAGQIGNSMMAGGQARASGYLGASEALNTGIGNALYAYRR